MVLLSCCCVFLWIWYDLATMFLWFPFCFPKSSFGIPMVFLWFADGFHMVSLGIPMEFLYYSSMVFLWFSWVFPSYSYGLPKTHKPTMSDGSLTETDGKTQRVTVTDGSLTETDGSLTLKFHPMTSYGFLLISNDFPSLPIMFLWFSDKSPLKSS